MPFRQIKALSSLREQGLNSRIQEPLPFYKKQTQYNIALGARPGFVELGSRMSDSDRWRSSIARSFSGAKRLLVVVAGDCFGIFMRSVSSCLSRQSRSASRDWWPPTMSSGQPVKKAYSDCYHLIRHFVCSFPRKLKYSERPI